MWSTPAGWQAEHSLLLVAIALTTSGSVLSWQVLQVNGAAGVRRAAVVLDGERRVVARGAAGHVGRDVHVRGRAGVALGEVVAVAAVRSFAVVHARMAVAAVDRRDGHVAARTRARTSLRSCGRCARW